MSAAPKRNPSLGLDSLDAEARKAARQAARHAGMSLDEWLAAVSANNAAEAGAAQTRKAQKRKRPEQSDELDAAVAKLQAVADLARKPAGIAAEELEGLLARAAEATERRSREQAAKTAAALGSVASWIERAEDRLSAASRNAAERQEHTTAVLGDALATMTARLDEIERKLSDGGRPSLEAALKAIERIESQLAKANDKPEKGANAAIETVLRGFETRIAEITDRLAERPPAGPRGPAEIRSAVAEIRARQAELDRTPEAADAARCTPPRAGARARAPLAGGCPALACAATSRASRASSTRCGRAPADRPRSPACAARSSACRPWSPGSRPATRSTRSSARCAASRPRSRTPARPATSRR